jgi:ATP-dependent metalloprotease
MAEAGSSFAGRTLLDGQKRPMSSYTSNYSRRLEQLDREAVSKLDAEEKQVGLLRQLNRVDPESVIRWFESRPLPHHSSAAMAEYVKALVKVDRLDESALLKTLQRGTFCAIFTQWLYIILCIFLLYLIMSVVK